MAVNVQWRLRFDHEQSDPLPTVHSNIHADDGALNNEQLKPAVCGTACHRTDQVHLRALTKQWRKQVYSHRERNHHTQCIYRKDEKPETPSTPSFFLFFFLNYE